MIRFCYWFSIIFFKSIIWMEDLLILINMRCSGKHRCNEAYCRWGCLRCIRFTFIPLRGSAISRAPGTLLTGRTVLSSAGTPASLLSRIARGRPGRRCSRGEFRLFSLTAESALATPSASSLFPKLACLFLLVFAGLVSWRWSTSVGWGPWLVYGPSSVEVSHACKGRNHWCMSLCSIWHSAPLECTLSSLQLPEQRSKRRHQGCVQLSPCWIRAAPCPSNGALQSPRTRRTSCRYLLQHDDIPANRVQWLCCVSPDWRIGFPEHLPLALWGYPQWLDPNCWWNSASCHSWAWHWRDPEVCTWHHVWCWRRNAHASWREPDGLSRTFCWLLQSLSMCQPFLQSHQSGCSSRREGSFASRVGNFPTSLSASMVWRSAHVSLIQSKALSGLVDADVTASLVLIL